MLLTVSRHLVVLVSTLYRHKFSAKGVPTRVTRTNANVAARKNAREITNIDKPSVGVELNETCMPQWVACIGHRRDTNRFVKATAGETHRFRPQTPQVSAPNASTFQSSKHFRCSILKAIYIVIIVCIWIFVWGPLCAVDMTTLTSIVLRSQHVPFR